jgi:hypothetical protein
MQYKQVKWYLLNKIKYREFNYDLLKKKFETVITTQYHKSTGSVGKWLHAINLILLLVAICLHTATLDIIQA